MAQAGNFRGPEQRQHRRYAVDSGALLVSWLDVTGLMKTARTRALNISEQGMAIELPEAALPLRIRFQSERFKVRGVGSVRYCRRAGRKYIVGLEFIDNLHWRPPAEDVREPIPICDAEHGL